MSGVTAHSSSWGGEHYVIFSSDWNVPATVEFMTDEFRPNHGFKKLLGCWEGHVETSFICNISAFYEFVLPSGMVDDQECVLILGATDSRDRRRADLWKVGRIPCEVSCLHKSEYIGLFQSVSKEVALRQDGWTQDIKDGRYYICIKE